MTKILGAKSINKIEFIIERERGFAMADDFSAAKAGQIDEKEQNLDELAKNEQDQKNQLKKMKEDEYKWYKIKMLASAVLVPLIYLIFFLLMKYT